MQSARCRQGSSSGSRAPAVGEVVVVVVVVVLVVLVVVLVA